MDSAEEAVTRLLDKWAGGDPQARERLIPLVYDELRQLARGLMRRERRDHTLQPTGLVHEALLRFTQPGGMPAASRRQLMALLAQTMRRVLVDHARQRSAEKRGGGVTHVPLDERLDGGPSRLADVLVVDETLGRLRDLDPRQAQIVELRVFGGYEVDEVADIVEVSAATVKREWAMARAWLHREMTR